MAKFFIPLGFRYWDNGEEGKGVEHEIATAKDFYSSMGSVYGPYEDQAAVDEALQRNWPNSKNELFLVFDGHIQKVKPSAKELPEDQKREPGNMDNYEKRGDAFFCKTCDGLVAAVQVAHPIHFNELPGAGMGECKYTQAPYCPNCEKRPSASGMPVHVPIFA